MSNILDGTEDDLLFDSEESGSDQESETNESSNE